MQLEPRSVKKAISYQFSYAERLKPLFEKILGAN